MARTVIIFVIALLSVRQRDVDGLSNPLKCPETEFCDCTINLRGHYNEYSCRYRRRREELETDNKYFQVTVKMQKDTEIEIACTMANDSYGYDLDDSASQRSVDDKWLSLLVGIEFTSTFDKMTIRNCPLPSATGNATSVSFKNNVLRPLRIEEIKNLSLNYITNGEKVFGDFYFRELHTLLNLQLQHNGIIELSPCMLCGLDDGMLGYLYLNNNKLRSLKSNLFAPVSRSLRLLELGHNNLTFLDDDLFRNTPNLVMLYAYGNKLHAAPLRRQVFRGLSNLRYLDLNGNGIESLSEDVFHDLSSLRDVNLNFNNITRLPHGVFTHCPLLERVRMSQSMVVTGSVNTTSQLPAALFVNLTSLAEVHMNFNKLTVLPDDCFYNAFHLITIFLNQNKLIALPANIFKYTVKLNKLDLSDNRLTSLNDSLFRSLKNLKILNLRNNLIKSITGDLFISLHSLEVLDLSNNSLFSVEPYSFASLIKLQVINLSHNQLNMSDDTDPTSSHSLLRHSQRIKQIYLRNNSVTTIFDDWLTTDLHLDTLDLSYNKIESVDGCQFLRNNPKLSVNLTHNRISFVNLTYLETTAAAMISQCVNSEPCHPEIFLDENPIVCDCRAYDLVRYYQRKLKLPTENWLKLRAKNLRCTQPPFLRNQSLSKVDLNELRCPWRELLGAGDSDEPNSCPDNCRCSFSPLDKSLIINCSGSDSSNGNSAAVTETLLPRQLPWAPFVQEVVLLLSNRHFTSTNNISKLLASSNVTKLSLSSNELESIDYLHIPSQLKVLELHDNRLSTLNTKTIEKLNQMSSLTRITFGNNPWICNCDTQHMANFLRAKYQQITDLENITCVENGKVINKLSIDELCPLSTTVIVISVSLAIFGVLFGSTILLYYRFQHEVKVWMFANKICLWLVTEKEIDCDKKYDAFVSYSHLDEPFVIEHLMPTLEGGPNPFRLCLHFRDWVVGEWIPTQIIRSVETSRRTIVVLSPNFLNSVWGQMEFRTAHLKAIKERYARVIVILLKDIGPTEKLDPELKAYLTMNTYVKWGDPWFWQKLMYALPHPPSLKSRSYGQQQRQISLSKAVSATFAKDIPARWDKLKVPSAAIAR